jgi:hypothetical protein
MKDKLITISALIAFAIILLLGASVFVIGILMIFPLALLYCMFSTNNEK